MVPYVYGQPEHASVYVCVYVVCECICLYTVKSVCLCVLYLHISVHTFVLQKAHQSVCLCVCVHVFAYVFLLAAVGEQGGANRPWCGCLCVTSTHGDGGMRLHASPRMSGNLLCVCSWVYLCMCACTVWFFDGRCDHTDHYVFVCHDDGLGIFASDTKSSCPANPQWYTAININLSGNESLFRYMYMDFSMLHVFLRCCFMIKFSLFTQGYTVSVSYCGSTHHRKCLNRLYNIPFIL